MNFSEIAHLYRDKAPQVYKRYTPYDSTKNDDRMHFTIRVWVDGGNFFVIKVQLFDDGSPMYNSSYVTGFDIKEHPMIQYKAPVPFVYRNINITMQAYAGKVLGEFFRDWTIDSYRRDITEPIHEEQHDIVRIDVGNFRNVYMKMHGRNCLGVSWNDYKFQV